MGPLKNALRHLSTVALVDDPHARLTDDSDVPAEPNIDLFLPQLRLALGGGPSKALQELDGKASLHDHSWAPYAVSREDWDATLVEAQESPGRGELFGKPAVAEPTEEPPLGRQDPRPWQFQRRPAQRR